jgi:hypothetical protein
VDPEWWILRPQAPIALPMLLLGVGSVANLPAVAARGSVAIVACCRQA